MNTNNLIKSDQCSWPDAPKDGTPQGQQHMTNYSTLLLSGKCKLKL